MHLGRPGEIGGTKVVHHWALQQMRQQRCLQHLPAGSPLRSVTFPRFGRAMPEGLSMASHHCCLAVGITGPGGGSLVLGDVFGEIQQGCCGVGVPLSCGHDASMQFSGIGQGRVAQQVPTRMCRGAFEMRQHRINAVGAGATHQAQNAHAINPWAGLGDRRSAPSPPAHCPPRACERPVGSPSALWPVLPPAR